MIPASELYIQYLKYVITGTGRCGTGFIARYLTSAGVTCGHERFFSTGGAKQAEINALYLHHLQGESSWLAAPYLGHFLLVDAKIIHLVRHPRKVIKSALKVGSLGTILGEYSKFNFRHMPVLSEYENRTTQVAYRYVLWNRLIEEKCRGRNYIFWRIEDDPLDLLKLLEIEVDNKEELFSDTEYNTKYENWGAPFNIKEIQDEKVKNLLLSMCAEYGYDWEDV